MEPSQERFHASGFCTLTGGFIRILLKCHSGLTSARLFTAQVSFL